MSAVARTESGPWPRDRWLDAMWNDESLKPNERLVAYVYARYAGAKFTTWCSWDELRKRTGLRSRDAVGRAIAGLVDAGWLDQVERPRQHHSARYHLTVPVAELSAAQGSGKQTPGILSSPPDGPLGEPSSPFNETSSPFNETSSPFNGPDISNGLLQRTTQTGAAPAPDPSRPTPPQAPGSNESGQSTSDEPPPNSSPELDPLRAVAGGAVIPFRRRTP